MSRNLSGTTWVFWLIILLFGLPLLGWSIWYTLNLRNFVIQPQQARPVRHEEQRQLSWSEQQLEMHDIAMFRGNPERNLSAVGTVPRRPKLLWRFKTRTKLEGAYERRGDPKLTAGAPWRGLGWTGQPIRVGDRLYFGSSDSYVYCLNAATGEVQ